MSVMKYLNKEFVMFLDSDNRDDVLHQMIEKIHHNGMIPETNSFEHAILDREKIVSTGIGMGVAIPHAKLKGYNNFFIAIGILKKGVEWHSIDETPVRLIFMIGGPDDKQTEYLQVLSAITVAIKDEDRRKKILRLSEPEEIIALFEEE